MKTTRLTAVGIVIAALVMLGCETKTITKQIKTETSKPSADASSSDSADSGSSNEKAVENSDDAKETEVSQSTAPKKAPPAGWEFESPFRIKAGGDFLAVESPGYACPTMADVDGDGKQDLVVGQFTNGHMQFCKNVSDSADRPKFATAEWIMTGDDRAEVPGVW